MIEKERLDLQQKLKNLYIWLLVLSIVAILNLILEHNSGGSNLEIRFNFSAIILFWVILTGIGNYYFYSRLKLFFGKTAISPYKSILILIPIILNFPVIAFSLIWEISSIYYIIRYSESNPSHIIYFIVSLFHLFTFILFLISHYKVVKIAKKFKFNKFREEPEIKVLISKDNQTREKLAKMIKVSDKLSMEQISSALNIEKSHLYQYIFDWAEKYGFRIDGEMVIFSKGNIDDFINSLDKSFQDWEEGELNKSNKI